MLCVELDIYSGRPNPEWRLSAKEEQELLNRVMDEPTLLTPVSHSTGKLGYRGLIIKLEKDDDGPWSRTRLSSGRALPHYFRIGGITNDTIDTALWLIESSQQIDSEVNDYLRDVAQKSIQFETILAKTSDRDESQPPQPNGVSLSCVYNYIWANYSLFNSSARIGVNNCYCFGANHLANSRYALPGRYGGRPALNLSAAEMAAGLAADGWLEQCTTNTLSLACVVWPGQDYHFYRLVGTSPYGWGHKPGATAAKGTDNAGNHISNPETCNRGPYTSFYGYWYHNNTTSYVA